MFPAMRTMECIQPATGELAVVVGFESMEVTAFQETVPALPVTLCQYCFPPSA